MSGWITLTTPPTWNVTDQELLRRLNYHLLETSGDATAFPTTPMFSQAQMLAALNQRQQKLLRDTACVLTRAAQATTPQQARYLLPTDWIHTRRIAWGLGLTSVDAAAVAAAIAAQQQQQFPGIPHVVQVVSGAFDNSNATRTLTFAHPCQVGHAVVVAMFVRGTGIVGSLLNDGGNTFNEVSGPDDENAALPNNTRCFLFIFQRIANPINQLTITLVPSAQFMDAVAIEVSSTNLAPIYDHHFGAMTNPSTSWGDGSAGNATPKVVTQVPTLLLALGGSQAGASTPTPGAGWFPVNSLVSPNLGSCYFSQIQLAPFPGTFGFLTNLAPATFGGAYILAIQP